MNWVDLQLLLPIALGALYGLRRGFIVGMADLVGMALSFFLAFAFFGAAAGWLRGLLDWPEWTLNLAAFGAILILTQILFGLLVVPRLYQLRGLLRAIPGVKPADLAAGTIPGAIKGFLLTALVLMALGVWPVVPRARTELQRSAIGRILLPVAGYAQPLAADLVGKLELPLPAALTGGPNDSFSIPATTRFESDSVSEEAMLLLVNEERKKFGLQPLAPDNELRAIARKYSEEQFLAGKLSHNSNVTGSLVDRLKAGGATYQAAGENLAYAPTAQTAHSGLMSSEGHRANILSPKFGRVGIGVAYSPGSGRVFTQVFAD